MPERTHIVRGGFGLQIAFAAAAFFFFGNVCPSVAATDGSTVLAPAMSQARQAFSPAGRGFETRSTTANTQRNSRRLSTRRRPLSSLSAGKTLYPGSRIVSPNGRYKLIEQTDGNLVLYDGKTALWWTKSQGKGARTTMQADGNLVTYVGSSAKWWSNTSGFAGARLVIQNDGNLVIYRRNQAIWTWGSKYIGDRLLGGNVLSPGDYLLSPDHQFMFVMQASDGNMVLYNQSTHQPLWSSGAWGAGAHADMQPDGNFVIYNPTAKWSSNTAQFEGASLYVQDDGNVVIYQNGHAIWTWSSGYMGDTLNGGQGLRPGAYLYSADHRYRLIEQPQDGNLVIYGPSGAVWAFDTGGHPGAQANMQTDGNFVVYSGGAAVRSTRTEGHQGAFIRMQNDGNLVVYASGKALWSRADGLIGSGSQSGSDPGNDYPAKWRNIPQDSTFDSWGEYNRECTSFVAWALSSRNGFNMPFYANARDWGGRASGLGYAVNGTPAIGAVAWSGSGNHVAYVQGINGGTVFIEEYNHDLHGNYSARWVPTSNFQYIHFKDR